MSDPESDEFDGDGHHDASDGDDDDDDEERKIKAAAKSSRKVRFRCLLRIHSAAIPSRTTAITFQL